MHHVPAGTSTQAVLHYGQECLNGGFVYYDHQENNTELYGQPTPPLYDLSAMTVPASLYWGRNDWLCAEEVTILMCFLSRTPKSVLFFFECRTFWIW